VTLPSSPVRLNRRACFRHYWGFLVFGQSYSMNGGAAGTLMMKRRDFLVGAGGATMSGLLLPRSSYVVADTIIGPADPVPTVEGASSSLRLVHERAWHIGDTDESPHVLGNGLATLHEQGPTSCTVAPKFEGCNCKVFDASVTFICANVSKYWTV
jgi:hypothetical protein